MTYFKNTKKSINFETKAYAFYVYKKINSIKVKSSFNFFCFYADKKSSLKYVNYAIYLIIVLIHIYVFKTGIKLGSIPASL